MTALKQMDPEFEAVAASLKQPFYKTFWRITVPVVSARDPGHQYLPVRQCHDHGFRRGVSVRARHHARLGCGAQHG